MGRRLKCVPQCAFTTLQVPQEHSGVTCTLEFSSNHVGPNGRRNIAHFQARVIARAKDTANKGFPAFRLYAP